MSNYILYNKRSCVTGKALFDELRNRSAKWRRRTKNLPLSCDVIVRWGNSYTPGTSPIELNANLSNATDKLRMMQLFQQYKESNKSFSPLPISFDNPEEVAVDGYVYARNLHGHVKYRPLSSCLDTDLYFSRPILSQKREYRVHIVDGKTVGVYEKIPNDPSVKIFKDHNCRFRRVDVSDEEQRQEILGVRPQARMASSALSLDFGGADIIVSEEGIFVVEFNSSPALNSLNICRWADRIENLIDKRRHEL